MILDEKHVDNLQYHLATNTKLMAMMKIKIFNSVYIIESMVFNARMVEEIHAAIILVISFHQIGVLIDVKPIILIVILMEKNVSILHKIVQII